MEECKNISGAVSLLHRVVDGKHQYEVENFLINESQCFAKKKDKIQMINDVETWNLPPEEFVHMLVSKISNSPMLTLHTAYTEKKHQEWPKSDTLKKFKNEDTSMSFSSVMVQKECLEREEETLQENRQEFESNEFEDDCFLEENILVVSMTNTCLSVLIGRGYESDDVCNCCNGCSCNRVVVSATHCEVNSVSKNYIMRLPGNGQFYIRSLLNTPLSPESIKPACRSYSTSGITMYYYKTNIMEALHPYKGSPVVLNFTGTNNFLKCVKDNAMPNEAPSLIAECYDKELDCIYKDDPVTWPFVFYMTSSKSNFRRFESAAFSGWFIHTLNTERISMAERKSPLTEDSFYFIIRRLSS